MCDWQTLQKDLGAVDFKTSLAIVFNVASSIAIILVNKAVFDMIEYKFGTSTMLFSLQSSFQS